MKFINLILIFCIINCEKIAAQYDPNFVEVSIEHVGANTIGMMKMSRKEGHIKVKYFASKDYAGTSVANRYNEWAKSKKIVMYTAGTYMTSCDANNAKPVGLCIDNGNMVNEKVESDKDALAIVYATGGIAVSDLKKGDLKISDQNGASSLVDIRKPFDKQKFKTWAENNSATVFQSHLLCYNNQLKITSVASPTKAIRRFLAVCEDNDGVIQHLIVNITGQYSLFEASQKIYNYVLNPNNEIKKIVFMINLDTGCQDVFAAFDSKGNPDKRLLFGGTTSIQNSSNLIVYYYE